MTEKNLPDVALEVRSNTLTPIDWVGMSAIELPIVLGQGAETFRIPAKVDANVSLDKKAARGIHMSRLYLLAQAALSTSEMNLKLLGAVTDQFLRSHEELSTSAFVQVHFEAPLVRKALKSDNQAWRTYPVILSCENRQGLKKYYIEVVITYSSTCPASAALSRQLIQGQFKQDFNDLTVDFEKIYAWLGTTQGIVATPHSQRSFARVKVETREYFNFSELIDLIENVLQTAVQGAVKREDEQEFALRNGQNLMFCEDAARRVASDFEKHSEILDFFAEFSHVESLHPHNAVSKISKGQHLRNF
jgi:GTP cyclohydrolase I